MEIDRRGLLLGTLSAVALAGSRGQSVAAAGAQAAYVAAARLADHSFAIVLLASDGSILRQLPLSARGHDIALHPESGRAVAFSRRPGTFAVAFETQNAREPFIFHAIEGRHFYGHGAFSADGRLLYVPENDIAAARGVIGIYDVAAGYKRIGEHQSHGTGPHEIILLEDRRTLAVANGGIDTVPDAGRAMLNLEDMRPSLTFMDAATGELLARHELVPGMNRLSIRHIAADAAGAVWFGGQWEGDAPETPELVGVASRDAPLRLITPPSPLGRALKGYIGSVAASRDCSVVAASAPKAGRIVYIATQSGAVIGESTLVDGCGVAGETGSAFAVTSGLGAFRHETAQAGAARLLDEHTLAGISFDNHLRAL